MKIRKSALKESIKEIVTEVLEEARYEEPQTADMYKDPKSSEKEKEAALRTWLNWTGQFGDIARTITSKSGYWYIGSGQDEIAKKIKKKSPEELKAFRKKVADLLRKSSAADKAMKDVQRQAQAMIKTLG